MTLDPHKPLQDVEPAAPKAPQAIRPDRRRFCLSRRQGHAMTLVLSLFTAIVALRLASAPQTHPDPLPPFPAGYDRLADRIDPNHADAGELAVLPGVGPAKAQAIIHFRDKARAQRQWPAFQRVDDLQQVYGIGPAIAAKLRPYVIFEEADRRAQSN